MVSAIQKLRVPANSESLQEARRRTFEFFRVACRSIPSVMEIYNLYDVVTPTKLRSSIASQIRKNAHITNTKVIDLLLFKGEEELNNITQHSKQRHHVIGQYVLDQERFEQDQAARDPATSDFLKNFYETNYF